MNKILGLIVTIALVIALVPFLIMVLWNWLMPVIFGLPIVTFWQAFGLGILSSLLLSRVNYKNND